MEAYAFILYQRYSIATFRSSTKNSVLKPLQRRRVGETELTNPTIGGCWARASGHVAAAPPAVKLTSPSRAALFGHITTLHHCKGSSNGGEWVIRDWDETGYAVSAMSQKASEIRYWHLATMGRCGLDDGVPRRELQKSLSRKSGSDAHPPQYLEYDQLGIGGDEHIRSRTVRRDGSVLSS